MSSISEDVRKDLREISRAEYVVIEYLEPYTPANRRVWEPVEGLGPLVFEATPGEAADFLATIGGAPGPFRVMPVATAVKAGLMPSRAHDLRP